MQKTLRVELTSLDSPVVSHSSAYGWDEGSRQVNVEGKVADIKIKRNGQSAIGIRILEDGSLIVTSYTTDFSMSVERNHRLTNNNPWEDEPSGD